MHSDTDRHDTDEITRSGTSLGDWTHLTAGPATEVT
jgi:hypothetical protein